MSENTKPADRKHSITVTAEELEAVVKARIERQPTPPPTFRDLPPEEQRQRLRKMGVPV